MDINLRSIINTNKSIESNRLKAQQQFHHICNHKRSPRIAPTTAHLSIYSPAEVFVWALEIPPKHMITIRTDTTLTPCGLLWSLLMCDIIVYQYTRHLEATGFIIHYFEKNGREHAPKNWCDYQLLRGTSNWFVNYCLAASMAPPGRMSPLLHCGRSWSSSCVCLSLSSQTMTTPCGRNNINGSK